MSVRALQSPNFRLFMAGSVFSLSAIWMARVTIGWLAWEMTGSASFVGLVGGLFFAPSLVMSPIFGVVTDRIDLRRGAIAAQSGQFLLAGLVGTLLFFSLLTPTMLAAGAALSGVCGSAYQPVRMAMTPRLVPRSEIGSIVSIQAVNFNLARATGPAISGVLIPWAGADNTMLVAAALFIPLLTILTRVELREPSGPVRRPPPFFAAMAEGLRLIRRTPVLRDALVLTGFNALLVRGALEILPVLADGRFARGAAGLGVLTATAGLGALVAGLAITLLPTLKPVGVPWAVHGMVALGLAMLFLLSAADSWPLALLSVALLSLSSTGVGILCQTVVQLSLEDGMRGRVMSLWGVLAMGGGAVGAGVLGVSADLLGLGPALAAAGTLGTTAFLTVLYRGMRH